jgi:hypothetical protein
MITLADPAKLEPNRKWIQRGGAETRRKTETKSKPESAEEAEVLKPDRRKKSGKSRVRVISGVQPKFHEHRAKCRTPKIFLPKQQEFNSTGTYGRS